MVVVGVLPATTRSLLVPSQLSPSSILLPQSASRLRHFPTASSTLIFKNHYCRHFSSNGDGSLPCLIRYPSSNSLSSLNLHRRLKPVAAVDSDLPDPIQSGDITKKDEAFEQWDWWTAKFAAGANLPFLLLQLPQIVLNARNLMAGNNAALLAVSWLGMLTGLLGNISLLSYFAKKKETEATIVQCLGLFTTYIVISQLAMGQAMPFPYYIATSVVVGTGVISNFLNYFGMLPTPIWHFWEDFITVGGLSVLPQLMWSTFVPYVPNSMLPGAICFVLALAAVSMARLGKLPEKGVKFVGAIAGWTATLLFMWMPIAQMWTNYLNPDNIKGLSALSMLIAVLGNGLLIPRALFARDFMWFIGSSWATFVYGWGNLTCLYMFNSISPVFFWGVTAGVSIWTGLTFWKDSKAYGHGSPLKSLKQLVSGSKS
ncbi:maltose excess protein 1-like, chloroplastic [Silene latifolia]|uniref:maltose excess protein 1-like, chloroplastic n=1 Tax=Silene latifolia TaxID=37657 RepID=UPI003D77C153